MSNRRSGFVVPDGKNWELNSIIGDQLKEVLLDSNGNVIATEIHVFIKAMNGEILTDIDKGKFGPKLYSSIQTEHSVNLPIVFSEKTAFSIQVFSGEFGSLELYDGSIFCSLTERPNY